MDALIEAGADPNCRNNVDWGPLLVSEIFTERIRNRHINANILFLFE